MRLIICLLSAGLWLITGPAFAGDHDASLDLYGSWRLHATAASADNAAPGQSGSYIGISDAYSRIGAKGRFFAGDTEISGKLELGLNTADFETGDPSFFDDEDFRIKSITAKGNWGTLRAGKDWLPYYNAVGAPVDYFSSIYAGYSTYAYFREIQLTYITPEIGGFTGSVSRIKRTGGGPMGWHYTASYGANGLTFAAGMEDMDGAEPDTYGASASYSGENWYGALKYEHNGAAGDIYNAFAQYTHGKLTYKAGAGLGDQYAGNSYHIGLDYQALKDFKMFAEIYSEQNNYAVLANGAESSSAYLGAGGFGARQNGKAILAGFRLDFGYRPFANPDQ